MKKLMLTVITIVLIALSLTACKKDDELTPKEGSTVEQIQKSLLDMDNYGCKATLKRISNKGENVYETKQFYKSSGEYRLEILAPEKIAGCITVFDGTIVSQYNPNIEGKIAIDVPASRARDEMFLGNFIKNYINSAESAAGIEEIETGKYTVMKTVIPQDHPYLATEQLWVNNETLKPEKLLIFDTKGKARIEVIFESFEYNMDISSDIFKVSVSE